MSDKQKKASAYWRENVRYLFILLSIWFVVSYGAGILFKDALNTIKIGGFRAWFLVCPARFHLCFCYSHFCLRTAYEQTGQEIRL